MSVSCQHANDEPNLCRWITWAAELRCHHNWWLWRLWLAMIVLTCLDDYSVLMVKHEQHGLYWDPGIPHQMQVAVDSMQQRTIGTWPAWRIYRKQSTWELVQRPKHMITTPLGSMIKMEGIHSCNGTVLRLQPAVAFLHRTLVETDSGWAHGSKMTICNGQWSH